MALEVVDPEQRRARGEREPSRRHDAHQQRAHEPGPIGDRERVKIAKLAPRPVQRLCHRGQHRVEMMTTRELGHDAAEDLVHVDLWRRRSSADPTLDHRRGRLVTRRLMASTRGPSAGVEQTAFLALRSRGDLASEPLHIAAKEVLWGCSGAIFRSAHSRERARWPSDSRRPPR